MAEIGEFLKERRDAGLLRSLRPFACRSKGTLMIAGRPYADFSSNDYLGLSGHPALVKAATHAINEHGTSSSASRLLSGDLILHHELEERIAGFKRKEAALVFNSGYQANVGIIPALFSKGDCIFSDRLNHASIVDGILLSGARLFRFRHNDAGHLESLLKKERPAHGKALIVTETVFSMDGDICPLKELVRLKQQYDCTLMVDEAHATGIFGRNGGGIVEEEGLQAQVDLVMGTFGKALGGFGAYAASSKETILYLINACRSFIYSTALPPGVISANLESINLVEKEPGRREKLLECARYFRESLKDGGFDVRGNSQIIPLIVGEAPAAAELACRLQEKGYWVLPIRPPTVPRGESRLRFSLTAYHTKDVLQKLIDDIRRLKI